LVLVGWGLVVICANNVGLFYGLFSSHMTAIRVFFVVFEKNGVIGRLTFVPQEVF